MFFVKNALKLTYGHLRVQKLFLGYIPEPPLTKEEEGRQGKGRNRAPAMMKTD